MIISFNRMPANSAWGGGAHFVTNFSQFLEKAGHKVVFDLRENIDLIIMIDPRHNERGYSIQDIVAYKQMFHNTKILHRVNECDKRKNTNFMDKLILLSNRVADHTVFISEWLQRYFSEKGFSKDSDIIVNGCNVNHFYPSQNTKPNEKIRVVTHHWSDNWLKGFDIYTEIDKYLHNNDDFEFTYVGRYFKGYTPQKTKTIEPLYGKQLGDELRSHDIYVTASRWEPCGMHHIEGAASGLPVLFHNHGGGINETCTKHGEVFYSFSDFISKLNLIKNNYQSYRDRIDLQQLGSTLCDAKYYDVILKMMRKT